MKFKTLLTTTLVLAGLSLPARAHEFVVKLDNPTPKAGQTVKAEFMASHVFGVSDEMEPVEDVQAVVVQGDQKIALPVKPNPAAKDLAGEFALPADGPAWINGHRLPQLWSQTPDGVKAGDRAALKGEQVISTSKYEKFVKVLLNPVAAAGTFDQPLGQTLEIIPLGNPADLKIGEEIKVRVLYDGQPISVPVYASYFGFSEHQNTYAYYTEPEKGDPAVKITAPGMWMIRAHYKAPGDGDIKINDYKAVLQFQVQ